VNNIEWQALQVETTSDALARSYGDWAQIIGSHFKPLFVSAFGDLFYVNSDLEVCHLDLLELENKSLGFTEDNFPTYINEKATIEQVLLSWMVIKLKDKGIQRKPYQVYAFAPHPIWSGSLKEEHGIVMDLYPWSSICRQLYAKGDTTQGTR
jgi:hypothetical protein